MVEEQSSSRDEFEKEFAKNASSNLFQFVTRHLTELKNKTWESIEVKKSLEKYVDFYRTKYGNVKVLGMQRPIPLDTIYTGVKMVTTHHLHTFGNDAYLEEYFRGKRELKYSLEPVRYDGFSLANDEKFLCVLGSPGSGKSTYMRRLGLEALMAGEPGNYYKHHKIPVLLELRRLREKSNDLIGMIADEFSTCGFPHSRDFVETFLENGKFLILLDGLDEVPSDQLDRLITSIIDFTTLYGIKERENRFVISCRIAFYHNFFSRFVNVVVDEFDDVQIHFFANNWFCSDVDKSNATSVRFLDAINEESNRAARELAKTPLLLTFLCLTFQFGQELPPTVATLYRRALDIMLREWAAESRVHNKPIPGGIHAELELDMLSEFAYAQFVADRYFFRRDDLIEHIRDFVTRIINVPKTVDPEEILFAIEVQQGLVVKRGQVSCSFSHLTIHEFLAAKELWNRGYNEWRDTLTTLVESRGINRWRELLRIMAGLGNADSFVLLFTNVTQEYLSKGAPEECHRRLMLVKNDLREVDDDRVKRAIGRILYITTDIRNSEHGGTAMLNSLCLRLIDLQYRGSGLRPHSDRTVFSYSNTEYDIAYGFYDRRRILQGYINELFLLRPDKPEVELSRHDTLFVMSYFESVSVLIESILSSYSVSKKCIDDVVDSILNLPSH